MSFYFSLLVLGFVLTIVGFSFLFVFLQEIDWGRKRKIREYVLGIAEIFLDIFLDLWSIPFILLLVGLAGIGLIIYAFMGMIGIL